MTAGGPKTVTTRVRYFAQARDLAGSKEEQLELPKPAHVHDLVSRAMEIHPQLVSIERILRVIVNGTITDQDVELHDGDTVVLMPPVAGG